MVKSGESKKAQLKRFKDYNKFLKDRGLPTVKKDMFMNTEKKATYRSSRSEKHYRKERVPKVGEINQTGYGSGSVGSELYKRAINNKIPQRKGVNEQRKYAKVGGKATPINKIKRGKTKTKGGKASFNNLKELQRQVNMSQKQVSNQMRKIDEINSAGWSDKKPSKVVQAFDRAHKARQEANKKKAMRKFKKPYNRKGEQGHNLKRGQSDGDKGRRKAHQQNKK